MPSLKKPRIHGHVACHECGEETELREQQNGRFYYNCNDRRRGCLAHHRFNPDIATPEDVPGFIPLRKQSVTAPIADPVKETENHAGPVPETDTRSDVLSWI